MILNKCDTYQIILVLINIFICFTDLSYANDQIIQIYSTYQSINVLTNTIIFKENVVLKYKHIKLYANEVIITHTPDKHDLSMIKAHGKPVILYHIPESGCMTSAQSLIVHYNTVNNIITFTGDARIEQSGNSVQSDNIIYSINQKKIQAISNKNSKTITILLIKNI